MTASAAGQKVPMWAWWAAGSLLALVLLIRDCLLADGGLMLNQAYLGRDFINVWAGGQLIRSGGLDQIYNPAAYWAFAQELFGRISPHNYSYPPVSFPIALAFSAVPYWAALALWFATTGGLFLWAVRRWWPANAGPFWLAALTPAATINIWAGQYGFLVAALFLLGWERLDRKPVQAGIFFGLMLIKPHLAALIPIALLIRGDWKAIASAASTVALLVLATAYWFGAEAWLDFIFLTGAKQAALIDSAGQFYGVMSCSPATAVIAATGNHKLAAAVQIACSIAAVGVVGHAAVRRVPTADLALLTATATFLLLPYSFNYDLIVVMIGAVTVWARSVTSLADRRLAIYGFLCPQLGMVLAASGLPLMPVMLGGLLFAQYRLALSSPRVSSGTLAAPAAAAAAPAA